MSAAAWLSRVGMARQVLLLVAATAAVRPAFAQESSLTFVSNFNDGRWIAARDAIEVRAVPGGTLVDLDRIAIMVGTTDWTSLFERDGDTWRYRPTAMALPGGESPVVVYLVTADGAWQEAAQLTLRVLTPGGFERVDSTPAASLNLNGQIAVDPPPADGARETYQDLTYALGWLSTLVRSGWTTTLQVNTVGTGRQELALRYGDLLDDAPLFDLADYLVSVDHRGGRVSVGHVSWDAQRHLVSQFSARGLSGTARFGAAVDVSGYAMNATTVVGWSNPLGLDTREHQLVGTTVGVELLPARPGGARLTASLVDASALPQQGYTEALVNDAETSRGLAARFTGSDAAERFTIDTGFARSRFSNPEDPFLDQGVDVVATDETWRNARYLDLTYAWLPPGKGSLSTAFRHARIDPLYRSIGAAVQADRIESAIELTAGARQVTSQFALAFSHDDLDDLPSLMRTSTRAWTWTTAVPIASLAPEAAIALPVVTYGLSQMRQYGDGVPENSLFTSESHVPDQATNNQTLGAEWQASRGRVGYQWNRSFQDNRQIGREAADFLTHTHTIGAGLTPVPVLDLGVDLSFESIDALEVQTADTTRRIGANATWRIRPTSVVLLSVMRTLAGNDPRTREGRVFDLNAQFTQDIVLSAANPNRFRGRVFVRVFRQTIRRTDREFGLTDEAQSWSITTGLTFRFF